MEMFQAWLLPHGLSPHRCGKIGQEAESADCMGPCEARSEDASRLLSKWFPVEDRTLSRERSPHDTSMVRGPHNLRGIVS